MMRIGQKETPGSSSREKYVCISCYLTTMGSQNHNHKLGYYHIFGDSKQEAFSIK